MADPSGSGCAALFASGFVTLWGGLSAGRNGFGIANRGELDAIGEVVKSSRLMRAMPAGRRGDIDPAQGRRWCLVIRGTFGLGF
jgi:hypothetical protein